MMFKLDHIRCPWEDQLRCTTLRYNEPIATATLATARYGTLAAGLG